MGWCPYAAAYRFGDASRNTIMGPSFCNLDCSLFKSFQFKVRYREAGTGVGSARYGAITSITGSMRQVQLGLKVLF